tara:strand:+ start:727 stop:1107 length:381 start_codon:yes stop_codon:yes gene_type:complete
MKQYLKNPFVIIGGLGLIYFLYKKKTSSPKIKKTTSAKKKLEVKSKDKPLEEQSNFVQDNVKEVAKAHKVPTSLVVDVAKMDIKKLARNILVNQRMLNRQKMSNDERNHILAMIDYMEHELEARQK